MLKAIKSYSEFHVKVRNLTDKQNLKGMFGDLMGKIGSMKSKMEEVKNRLSNITVQGESSNGKVKIEMDGNKLMKDISINYDLKTVDSEELNDMIVQATNRAIEQAEKMYEAEMAASAKDFLPGMGL